VKLSRIPLRKKSNHRNYHYFDRCIFVSYVLAA